VNIQPEKDLEIVERTLERIDRVEKHTVLRSHEPVRLSANTGLRNSADIPAQRVTAAFREPAMPVRPSAPQTLPVTGMDPERPEIHIAIGRVIVNASQASVPRPQIAAPAPAVRLTLDQYLRQRGGRS
jgi:hypothetical protein